MSKRTSKKKKTKSLELFISPVLNLFIILIPFLLMSAVFVQTSVIDLYLPTVSKARINLTSESKPNIAQEKLLILSINPQNFSFILQDKVMNIIPRKKNNYNFDECKKFLQIIREKFPSQKSIIIEPDDSIIYDYIIHIMDQCRDVGLINITLSADKG